MTSTTSSSTRYATSADGTRIAYETRGSGPALVLVDGAMCHRAMGPARDLADAAGRQLHRPRLRPSGPWRERARLVALRRRPRDRGPARRHRGGRRDGARPRASRPARPSRWRRPGEDAPIDRLVVYEAPFIVDDTHPANDPRLPAQAPADGRGRPARRGGQDVPAHRRRARAVHLADAADAGLAEDDRDRAHAALRPRRSWSSTQQGEPLPPGYYDAVAPATLVLAGGKSPALHAQRAGGDRRGGAGCAARGAARADPHGAGRRCSRPWSRIPAELTGRRGLDRLDQPTTSTPTVAGQT